MQRHKFALAALAGLCGMVVVGAAASRPMWTRPAVTVTSVRVEVQRLQHHFMVVERELLTRDVAHLSSAQREARLRNIERLRRYSETAVFPHNHEPGGQRVPFFRDEHGTLCAMAYLIASAGGADIVNHTAETNNQVYMRDLAADREVTLWLEQNGLTLDEAARIQPTYGEASRDGDSSYQVASTLMAGTEGGLIVWNLTAQPGTFRPGVVGIVGGALGFTLGLSGIGQSEISEALVTVNLALGATTVLVGVVRTIVALKDNGRASERTPTPARRIQWSPLLQSDAAGRTQIGVQRRF